MLKNFSQQFERLPTNIYFLAKNNSTNKYIVEFAKSLDLTFYKVPHMTIDNENNIALQITKFLHSKGYIVTRFRILNRETDVHFSFKDNTPGETRDNVCIYAEVDILNAQNTDTEETSLVGLLKSLEASPVYDPCVTGGARILKDREP